MEYFLYLMSYYFFSIFYSLCVGRYGLKVFSKVKVSDLKLGWLPGVARVHTVWKVLGAGFPLIWGFFFQFSSSVAVFGRS